MTGTSLQLNQVVQQSASNDIKGMEPELYIAALYGSFLDMSICISCMPDWKEQTTITGNNVLHVHVGKPLRGSAKDKKMLRMINVKLIKEVLDHDSSLLWKVNNGGNTPLHLAARFGFADVVQVFLERAAKDVAELVRMINNRKDTALHEAARAGHVDVVKRLVTANFKCLYGPNEAGETPLYLAAERGSTEAVAVILDMCDYSAMAHRGPSGRTALHAAVQWGNSVMVKKMLEKDRSLMRIRDNEGQTPLHSAAAEISQLELLKVLLEHDQKGSSAIYILDNKGRTALHIAMLRCSWGAMKALMTSCPDCIEIVDNDEQNVVHYAAKWNCLTKIDSFLKLGHFDELLNQKDVNGDTPLHHIVASIPKNYTHPCLLKVRNFIVNHTVLDLKVFNKQDLTVGDIMASYDRIIRRESILQGLSGAVAPRGRRINTYEMDLDVEKARGDDLGEGTNVNTLKEAAQSRLVVAALIATVSFTAGFTLPGGFDQNLGDNMGMAVLKGRLAFKVCVVSNAIAFMSSTIAILLYFVLVTTGSTWFIRILSSHGLMLNTFSLGALMIAFTTGVSVVVSANIALVIALWGFSTLFFVYYVTLIFQTYGVSMFYARRCSLRWK
ncbi:ankyrin repeat-containing protein At5g02620-like [Chenopodium quinoa]|uniref:ankyrin repeat-containing protein At5g02620-like n=1 Tax=Chenopodium quinoa TaxID=63459 RepID=UPI000B7790FF|nr:ankyrin repeat-containing protein At5g02620-like [Chenopodium quinoa]